MPADSSAAKRPAQAAKPSPESVAAAQGVPESVSRNQRLAYQAAAWLTLVLQLALFGAVLALDLSLAVGLAGHGLIALGLVAWAFARPRSDYRPQATLAVAASLLYVFGTLGCLLAFRLYLRGIRERMDSDSWYTLIFPPVEYDARDQIYAEAQRSRQLVAGERDVEVAPFSDIFERGSVDDRVQVTAFLARHFKPEYAEALQYALRDSNAAIRTQAAAIASRLDSQMTETLRDLYATWEKHPEDIDASLALADHYDYYAHSGLLSASVAQTYRQRALDLYLRVLAQEPTVSRARLRATRLLLRLERVDEANTLLDAAPDLDSQFRTWLPWLCEAYFRQGRYDDLRTICQRAKAELSLRDVPVAVKRAIELWAGGDESDAA